MNYLLLLFLIVPSLTVAQPNQIISDSDTIINADLRNLLNQGDRDYYDFKKDQAIKYYLRALKLAESLDEHGAVLEAAYNLAHVYFEQDDYDSALYFNEIALEMANLKDRKLDKIRIMTLICEVYNYQGKDDLAVTACLSCLNLMDETGNNSGKANVLNVLGNIHLQMKDFSNASRYLREALQIALAQDQAYDIATTYISMGDLQLEKNNYDSALSAYRKAKHFDEIAGDTLGLAYSNFAIGNTLLKLEKPEAALLYLDSAHNLAVISKDYNLQSIILSQQGLAFTNLNRLKEAINSLHLSLKIAEEIEADPLLKDCYKNLAQFYEMTGDSSKSLEYYKSYMLLVENSFQGEFAKKIADAEAYYDLGAKEREIELLRKENEIQLLKAEQRDLINKELIAGIVLVLLMAGVLYSRNRIKNKSNRILQQQKEAINQQKKEIEAQNSAIEKQNQEMAEKSKQITDSIQYAHRIQLSLLPGNADLKKIFPSSFVFYQPRDIVSGDFYWLASRKDKTYLAVVDCTGHGVPGAFMTILANTLLNQIILENKISSSSVAITLLDLKVQQNVYQKEPKLLVSDLMDIGLCIIDHHTREIEFTGARSSLFFTEDGKLKEIKGDRFAIGNPDMPDKHFTANSFRLQQDAFIYLASDGYQDQFGGEDDSKFMKTNFRGLLDQICHKSITEQYNQITDQFYSWKGNFAQTDDVLVVGIKP